MLEFFELKRTVLVDTMSVSFLRKVESMLPGRPRVLLLVFVMVLFCPGVVIADEADDLEQDRIKEALKLTTTSAQSYAFTLEGNVSPQCELHPESILKWSNPVAGSIHGNVFLWTHDKRPVAVGSFFQWFSPWTHMTHEFHVLTDESVNAAFHDSNVWTPKAAQVKFERLREVPTPRSTPNGRRIQMRSIAREFICTKTDETEDTQKRQLRLLTQPVYRYSSSSIKDGALFVFVQGTDPEVWLLLEAVELTKSDGEMTWRFAAARMNTTELQLKRRDEIVWRAEKMEWRKSGNTEGPYFKINADKLPKR